MHNIVATGFDVSTKNNVGKGPFGDCDTDCYGLIRKSHGLIRKDTCQDVCTANKKRFTAVQVRVSTSKNGLIRISTNRHGATRTWYDKRSAKHSCLRIQLINGHLWFIQSIYLIIIIFIIIIIIIIIVLWKQKSVENEEKGFGMLWKQHII